MIYVIEVKGKVIPVHAMKEHRGVAVWLHQFLTSAIDGVIGQIHPPPPRAALFPERKCGTR
jgi:hypothetical protein